MREKQRYQIYKWVHTPKLSFMDFETLVHKDLERQIGDFGVASLGPRFKLFPVGARGFVVKVRIEAHTSAMKVLKEIKGIRLVHVAGSARLAQRAVLKKLEGAVMVDTKAIW